jgi:hypothetical protein
MRAVYAKELADRTAAGRRAFAQQLLKDADTVRDNPVDRYVLLAGAIEAAKDAGSLQDCVTAGDAMGSEFLVDSLSLKTDAATTLVPLAADAAAAAASVNAGLQLIDQLVGVDDLAAAARVCTSLQGLANVPPSLRQTLLQRAREVTAMKGARGGLAQAMEKLKQKPDDPEANLAVGSYYCFARNDWATGLPFLAKGPDSDTKSAASADLGNPQTPEGRTDVGHAWWTASEKEPSWQTPMRLRAAAWYSDVLASGKLTGLNRIMLEKRVAEVTPAKVAERAVEIGKFQIISATYGFAEKRVDATQLVQAEYAKDPFAPIGASDVLLGGHPDPKAKSKNFLHVVYTFDGKENDKLVVAEGDVKVFPYPDEGLPSAAASETLTIVAARYGVPGNWKDVTQIIRTKVTNPNKPLDMRYEDFGADPAPKRTKHLVVWFSYHGRYFNRLLPVAGKTITASLIK